MTDERMTAERRAEIEAGVERARQAHKGSEDAAWIYVIAPLLAELAEVEAERDALREVLEAYVDRCSDCNNGPCRDFACRSARAVLGLYSMTTALPAVP